MNIEEKLEYKTRLQSNKFLVEIPGRIEILEDAYNEMKKIENNEIRKYFPVSLVALMEQGIKLLVEEKVDEDDSILEKLTENFIKDKIDKNIFIKLQKKKYSRGEFISLYVKINRAEDIKKILQYIFNEKIEIDMKNLVKCFEYRHIIAHESPWFLNIELKEIKQMMESVFELLKIIECKLLEEKKYQIFNRNKWNKMFEEEQVKVEISKKIFESFMNEIIQENLNYKDITEYQDIVEDIEENIKRFSRLLNLISEDGRLYEFLVNKLQKEIYNYLNFEIVQRSLKTEKSYSILDEIEKGNPEKMKVFIEDMNQLLKEEK